jgi:hypothetical protein
MVNNTPLRPSVSARELSQGQTENCKYGYANKTIFPETPFKTFSRSHILTACPEPAEWVHTFNLPRPLYIFKEQTISPNIIQSFSTLINTKFPQNNFHFIGEFSPARDIIYIRSTATVRL